jgi:hypothetical protein
LPHIDAARDLNAVDERTFLATFSALIVLYAAWIATPKLMRARMAVKCDSGRMADQAASLAR